MTVADKITRTSSPRPTLWCSSAESGKNEIARYRPPSVNHAIATSRTAATVKPTPPERVSDSLRRMRALTRRYTRYPRTTPPTKLPEAAPIRGRSRFACNWIPPQVTEGTYPLLARRTRSLLLPSENYLVSLPLRTAAGRREQWPFVHSREPRRRCLRLRARTQEVLDGTATASRLRARVRRDPHRNTSVRVRRLDRTQRCGEPRADHDLGRVPQRHRALRDCVHIHRCDQGQVRLDRATPRHPDEGRARRRLDPAAARARSGAPRPKGLVPRPHRRRLRRRPGDHPAD